MKGLKLAYLPLTTNSCLQLFTLLHPISLRHNVTQSLIPAHHFSYTRFNSRDPFMWPKFISAVTCMLQINAIKIKINTKLASASITRYLSVKHTCHLWIVCIVLGLCSGEIGNFCQMKIRFCVLYWNVASKWRGECKYSCAILTCYTSMDCNTDAFNMAIV